MRPFIRKDAVADELKHLAMPRRLGYIGIQASVSFHQTRFPLQLHHAVALQLSLAPPALLLPAASMVLLVLLPASAPAACAAVCQGHVVCVGGVVVAPAVLHHACALRQSRDVDDGAVEVGINHLQGSEAVASLVSSIGKL
jgi:hypothetical protein